MKLQLTSKKSILSIVSVLVALALLLAVVPAVYAGTDEPLSPIPGLGRLPNATLVMMHNKEIGWFNDQDVLLRDADRLASEFQKLIDAESKNKKDVTILKAALADFDAEVTTIRAIHATSATIVFSITGFKVNGDVRDRLAAGQTLLDGRTSLKDGHFRLVTAMDILSKSYDRWRHDRIHPITVVYP